MINHQPIIQTLLWWSVLGYTTSSTVDSDVTYRCFNGYIDQYEDVPAGNASEMMKYVDLGKKTAFFIHGWHESCHNESATAISKAFLSRDHNVICVDWSGWAALNLFEAASKAMDVADVVTEDIINMQEMGLNRTDPHICGFSLGAQSAGRIGRNYFAKTQRKLARITGLDAANPLYYPEATPLCPTCEHMTDGDAEMVVAVHTDAGFYGASEPTGRLDFYVNSGSRFQYGCPSLPSTLSITEFLPTYRCSHDRSWKVFSEALTNDTSHIALRCDTWLQFKSGMCSGNWITPIGLALLQDSPNGTYYYQTNAAPMFGRYGNGTTSYGLWLFWTNGIHVTESGIILYQNTAQKYGQPVVDMYVRPP